MVVNWYKMQQAMRKGMAFWQRSGRKPGAELIRSRWLVLVAIRMPVGI